MSDKRITTATPAEQWGIDEDVASHLRAAYQHDENNADLGVLLRGTTADPTVPISLPLEMFNRHGLVTGATGTGKTRTLQLLAERLSQAGVPTLVTDVKGDLTGMTLPGEDSEKLRQRVSTLHQNWQGQAFPVEYLGLAGAMRRDHNATAIRATVTDFGPLLMAKALNLNEVQEQALQLIYDWADQKGLGLVDLKDLREVVYYLTGDGKDELKRIGGVSTTTAGVILRATSVLASQGGDRFFAVPAFDTADLLKVNDNGLAVVSNLNIGAIDTQPNLVACFLMWLLADLFDSLPEVGDLDRPRLVLFLDEAHILFDDASKNFIDQVVRTVRLIRSKGVGIVFVTQDPTDIPTAVSAQIATRIMHAQRAYTPKQLQTLQETVSTLPSSSIDLSSALSQLGTGEALVTALSRKGVPLPATPTRLYAPASNMGQADPVTIETVVSQSVLRPRYEHAADPFSAFEALTGVPNPEINGTGTSASEGEAQGPSPEPQNEVEVETTVAEPRSDAPSQKRQTKAVSDAELEESILGQIPASPYGEGDSDWRGHAKASGRKGERKTQRSHTESTFESGAQTFLNSALRTLGTQIGREISRTIFGTRRRR